jgi:hypothetical protein
MVNKMSGKPEKIRAFSLERDGIILNGDNLASALNEFYVSVNTDIPSLDNNSLPAFLPSRNDIPGIQPHEVCNKLCALPTHNATGPDEIPNRMLKEFAFILAEPIATIFNK